MAACLVFLFNNDISLLIWHSHIWIISSRIFQNAFASPWKQHCNIPWTLSFEASISFLEKTAFSHITQNTSFFKCQDQQKHWIPSTPCLRCSAGWENPGETSSSRFTIYNILSCVHSIGLQTQVSARLCKNSIRTCSQPTLHLSASPPGGALEHSCILQPAPLHRLKIWAVNCPASSFCFSFSCKRSQLVLSVLGVNYSKQIEGAHFLVFRKLDRLCEGRISPLLRQEGTASAGPDCGRASGVGVGVKLLSWNGAALLTKSAAFPKLEQNSKCIITDSGSQKAALSWMISMPQASIFPALNAYL